MHIRLKPIEIESAEFKWEKETRAFSRYALVGKSSGSIHMIFDAQDQTDAEEIMRYYASSRRDSGYRLMRVITDL